jgi:hypothetical protein
VVIGRPRVGGGANRRAGPLVDLEEERGTGAGEGAELTRQRPLEAALASLAGREQAGDRADCVAGR